MSGYSGFPLAMLVLSALFGVNQCRAEQDASQFDAPSKEVYIVQSEDKVLMAMKLDEGQGINGVRRLTDPPLSFALDPPLTELVDPDAGVPVPGSDPLIGVDLSVRGYGVGQNETTGNIITGLWERVIMLKVAMLAFANGMVIDTGSNRTLENFKVIFVDSCQVYQGSTEFCGAPWAMRLANALFYGDAGRPPVTAALINSQFTTQYAGVASGANIPAIGATSNEAQLSDKVVYPSFVRTNPTEAVVFNATLGLLNHLGFTVVDVVVCDHAGSRAGARNLLDVLQADGIAAAQYLVAQDAYTAMWAGSLEELVRFGPRMLEKKKEWDSLMAAMLLFNAHAHVDLMQGDLCPKLDFMSYIELAGGLFNTGHVWMGDAANTKLAYYEAPGGLVYTYTVMSMRFLGFTSPYASAKPLDGYIFTAAESTRETLPANVAFWNLMHRVGQQQDVLGPDLAGRVPPEVFSNRGAVSWFLEISEYMVDALFAVLLATESAVKDIGPAFTRSELLEYVRRMNFDGITGRVKFDANGDRIVRMDIQQYNLEPGLEQVYVGMPRSVRTIGSFLEGSLVFTEPFIFYSGSTALPPNRDLECGTGSYYERSPGKCFPCAPGTVSGTVSASSCSLCSPGEYARTGGLSTCAACTEGTFSASPGSTGCQACAAGLFVGEIQQSECRPCAEGTFSDEGAAVCDFCDPGTFAAGKGNVNCTSCPAGFTTRNRGSVAEAECLCNEGYFRSRSGGADACLECPEGMQCDIGSDEANIQAVIDGNCGGSEEDCMIPRVKAGYMTRIIEPLRVFECLGKDECPGGIPGSCGENRDSTAPACAECLPDAYQDGSQCLPCGDDGVSVLPIILFFVAGSTLIVALTYAVNRDLLLQQNSVLSVGILFGLTISAIQLLGVFRSLAMEWFEPLATIFRLCSVVGFNIEVLRLSCSFRTGSLSMYVARQLITPFVACFVGIVILVKRRISSGPVDTLTEYSNALGTVYSALFISIASSCVLPFVCYDHPDNSSSSMLSDPAILCWSDDLHGQAVGIAVTAFIIVLLPFVVLVVWATWKYPAFVIDANNGGRMLQCFRFLFFRFKAEAYYYAAAFMLRSLVLCLIPAVVRNNAASQVCIMAAVIVMGHTLQTWLQPWRTAGVNFVDGVVTAGLLLMMFCGAASFDFAAEMATIQALGTICFTICTGSLVTGVVGFIIQRLSPSPWFQFFVCHHKRDAAAQARYIKVLLQMRGKKVFIDSDDLKDLDTLFDIVKSSVEHLVVYLTREVLTRPWCAGEIATSVKKGIRITKVHTPSFLPPTEENYTNIESYLDLTSTSLTQYAISYESVASALRTLLSTAYPTITMDPELAGLARISEVVSKLASGSNDSSKVMSSTSWKIGSTTSGKMGSTTTAVNKPFTSGMVLVSSDPSDDEASAAAGILVAKMRLALIGFMQEGVFMLAGEDDLTDDQAARYMQEARCIIVILSARTLRCPSQLKLIIQSMDIVVEQKRTSSSVQFAAIPVSVPFFQFPSPDYFNEDLPKYLTSSTEKDGGRIHMFFKRLAIAFATHASDDVIESQVTHVVAAIPRGAGPWNFSPSGQGVADDKPEKPELGTTNAHEGWAEAPAVEEITSTGFEALMV